MVLGVRHDAGDAEIREAYLAAIRKAPPESDPERFAAVSRAYARIKDERSRIRTALFNLECPGDSPLDAIVRAAHLQGPPSPPSIDVMKQYLRKCAEETGKDISPRRARRTQSRHGRVED
jgi:curved DNA-binding protein CbpA